MENEPLKPVKRVYHLARMVNRNGEVSPWCSKKPKAIDLSVATWTNRLDAVTCSKCIKNYKAEESK